MSIFISHYEQIILTCFFFKPNITYSFYGPFEIMQSTESTIQVFREENLRDFVVQDGIIREESSESAFAVNLQSSSRSDQQVKQHFRIMSTYIIIDVIELVYNEMKCYID